jgi:hypothetical protein
MTNDNQVGAPSISLASRLLWLCPILGLVAGAVILWVFGLSLWTAILVALLAACPLILAWLVLREARLGSGRRP